MANTGTARRFSDKDKAAVLATLAANGGNLKRTARECNVLPATVRRWRDQARAGQGPPEEAVQEAVTEFVSAAARVRDLALVSLEQKIREGSLKGSELITTVGVLDDKIRLATGQPTSRTEAASALPPPDALRELMAGVVQGAIAAAERRHGEIVDAEIVREIPASTAE
jgi:transposase-like protein